MINNITDIEVSIVVPMYNAESTISSALDSVLKQTYQGPLEVIIVNDGSIDQSEQVVKDYIRHNTSKNVIINLINQENSGVSSARNAGIKQAKGEWVALLDSDDVWLPLKLEKQMDEIKKNADISFIGCNRNGEIYPYFDKKEEKLFTLNAKQLLIKWYPQTSTVLMSSKVLHDNKFDERRKYGEDGDLWLRILESYKIYVLNQDLVITGGGKRHFGESGLSANLSKMFSGELLNLRDALMRKQISFMDFAFLWPYMYLKYVRRIIITKVLKRA
ncbi:glycosyltransferase family 2 protein [Vibrio sp. Of7-15]|uniref:glycosyltransferase family 2 protein n=1 Tax=Vibrio sp. Of7-15 TaxID=2724879 RepID=UPI0023B818CE|nr:glycosyltransferase family 2 protein [Vibrio sp. Of7-15]MCG7496856.1 glycosyltransferase family 2 protein [Vibrio sp. Of7-15]